jgi:hypothetical protein
VGGIGVDVKGSGSVRIFVRLASGQIIHRTVHAMYTPDLSSRCAYRIGRLLTVRWMQSHSGCGLFFPNDSGTGLLVVPTWMGVLEPSGNGLYLLPHHPELPQAPHTITRAATVPMLPSLPIAVAPLVLDNLICKAYRPSTPTVSQLA